VKENFNVLIICYNRSSNLTKLIKSVLKNTNSIIYIHQDGSKKNINEDKKINKVRKILKKFENNRVIVFNQEKNLGCYLAVKFAIDWAMKESDYLLVLEDDLCIQDSAFNFIRNNIHLLTNSNVATISLFRDKMPNNLITRGMQISPLFNSWGWATSKAKWQLFNAEIGLWRSANIIYFVWCRYGYQFAYKLVLVNYKMRKNKLDSWAYRWFFTILSLKMVNVYPPQNFIKNIGFGKTATHTKNKNKIIFENFKRYPSDLILTFLPNKNLEFDKYILKSRFGMTNFKKFPNVR
jgi:glycosyltransferase involved in cell wall biosynthesis